jgi:hypothetical protein
MTPAQRKDYEDLTAMQAENNARAEAEALAGAAQFAQQVQTPITPGQNSLADPLAAAPVVPLGPDGQPLVAPNAQTPQQVVNQQPNVQQVLNAIQRRHQLLQNPTGQ